MSQVWHLQPALQKEVDGVLREFRKLAQPTIAFHVRGGDLTSAADEQLFDVWNNPPCTCTCCNPPAPSSRLSLFGACKLAVLTMQDEPPDSKAKDMIDTYLRTYPDVKVCLLIFEADC